MRCFRRFVFFVFVLKGFCSNGQSPFNQPNTDTLALTIYDAEQLFLKRNYQLLAASYNIDAYNAAIIQAKLYPNPTLSIDQGAYNHVANTWFDVGKTGQTAASLQQLILLGGKRNISIEMAKLNTHMAQYAFFDLMSSLRYQLITNFYHLYFLQQSAHVYESEIEALDSMINAYNDSYQKGNISLLEYSRIQSLRFSLQNEMNDLLKNMHECEANLTVMIADTSMKEIKPVVTENLSLSPKFSELRYEQLLDSALNNRYDLLQANAQCLYEKLNLSLQKAYRIPDITTGANWDRAGSYISNYNSVSLAFDLPFLNRNQGNIKSAQFKINESQALYQNTEMQIKTEVQKAWLRVLETNQTYSKGMSQFNPQYDLLLDGILKSFKNKTISLVEFIDYYETYKNSKVAFHQLQYQMVEAKENLNRVTGSVIFK
jgi:cobalt-zinc-cadmium efflux system outer membrane protein